MAAELKLVSDVSCTAGEDLSSSQFKAVYLSADDTVKVIDATTRIPFGVLQNAPASGGIASVRVFGVSKFQVDESLAAGNLVRVSADGQAAKHDPGTDTAKACIGQVKNGATNAGEYAEVLINCANPSQLSNALS